MNKKAKFSDDETLDPEYQRRRQVAKIFIGLSKKYGSYATPMIEKAIAHKVKQTKVTKQHSVKNSNKQPKGGGKKK